MTPNVYDAYGAHTARLQARTAYAEAQREADTGWYLLGARLYSPTLRQFLAPDRVSPFDGGGINRYTYCGGDPINRVDPSGHTWRGWAGALWGLAAATGAVRPMPFRAHTNDASSTPTTIATTVVAVTDTVSITSAIDSPALMAGGGEKSADLLGWVAAAKTVDSGGLALPAARFGSPQERFVGRQRAITRRGSAGSAPEREVTLKTGTDIPPERMRNDDDGNPYIARLWHRRAHPENSESHVWSADTAITVNHFATLFASLEARGTREVYIYTGAHGSAYGDNWSPETGKRLHASDKFFLEDFTHARELAGRFRIRITPVNMGNLTSQQMKNRLARTGVHIIGSCYGLADEVVMEVLHMTHTTVYRLN
jgi:RHS repeat-associated protein